MMSFQPERLNTSELDNESLAIVSKVLVCDYDAKALELLKPFCEDNNLVGYKVHTDNIIDVLKSNIDLGAIFIAENVIKNIEDGTNLLVDIHRMRIKKSLQA